MSKDQQQTTRLTEEQVQNWERGCIQDAQKHLAQKGFLPEKINSSKAVILPPLVSVWNIACTNGKTYWVISGDLPTDCVENTAANTPREVLRHFSFHWQMKADGILKNYGDDKTQAKFANLLIARAHGLYELYEKDELWVNVAS